MGSDNESTSQAPKRKWKKKKSLLATARKYGKKEWWGRGANIPEDMYHYLVGILEVMKTGFTSKEDKQNFVNNVLEKTINEEVTLSCNQLGCRIIEELLPFSTSADLERYIETFSPQLRILCCDKYASFVLEQMLTVCCTRSMQNQSNDEKIDEPETKKRKKDPDSQSNYSAEHIENCHAFTIKLSKYMLNNLEDFIWDSSANRILRTSIKCLGGIVTAPGDKPKQNLFKDKPTDESNNNSKNSLTLEYRQVPDEYKEIVKEHATRLMMWPQFTDLPYETATSGLLQMLIFALGNICKKMTKTFAKKLLDESFAPSSWKGDSNSDEKKDDKKIDVDAMEDDSSIKPIDLPPVFNSESSVRLLEAVLYVARSKTYTQIYAKCFINRLEMLALSSGLNFTVQRLFDNCSEKEEFEPMFDELSEKFKKILTSGKTGVLAAIAKACLRLQSKQVKFIQAMEQTLECSDPDNHRYFTVLCARLLPLKNVDITKNEEPYFVNIHGSVLIQTMLSFQRPKRVIDSILAMSTKELLVLFCDSKGCHIGDSYFEGQFVGAKSRELLIKRLKGTYQELAVSKYGSRVLEKAFAASTVEQKITIMEELSKKSQLLNSTMFGQLISTKLRVELYMKSFNSWKSTLNKEEKVKKVFSEITTEK